MRRTRLISIIAVCALLIGGGVAAAARSAPPASASSFVTDGQGRSLVLSGFSTASSSKSAPDGLPAFTQQDLTREHADMGTNFVRFLISWRAVEPEPGRFDNTYLDALEKRVGWYAARGYHVMLDMHQDLYGSAITPSGDAGNGAPAWATKMDGLPVGSNDMWELYYLEPGVMRAFDNFWNTTGEHPGLEEQYAEAWKAVAARFAHNPTVVAYDLMNEPYGGSLQGPIFESGPLTRLYQRTVDAIRTVDTKTWACLEPQAMGVNWGTPSGLAAVHDPRSGPARIAYCPHLYPLSMDLLGQDYVGSDRAPVDATLAAWRADTIRTAQALGGVPIILGEFGLDTTLPGALDYVKRVYAMAGSMGAGVAYWSRDDGTWGPYDASGAARNLVPVIDRAYPLAVAGTPTSWSSSAHRLELRLAPDPSVTAPTTVYLPSSGFPSGGSVTGARDVSWDAANHVLSFTVIGDAKTTVVVTPR